MQLKKDIFSLKWLDINQMDLHTREDKCQEKEALSIFTLLFKAQTLEVNEIFDHLSYRETNCLAEIFVSNHTWPYMFVSWFMSFKHPIATLLVQSQK